MVFVRSSNISRHFAAPSSSVLTAPPGLHKNRPSQQHATAVFRIMQVSTGLTLDGHWVNMGQRWTKAQAHWLVLADPLHTLENRHPPLCAHFVTQRAKSDPLASLWGDICHPNVKSGPSSAIVSDVQRGSCCRWRVQNVSCTKCVSFVKRRASTWATITQAWPWGHSVGQALKILYLLRCRGSSRIFGAPARHLFCLLSKKNPWQLLRGCLHSLQRPDNRVHNGKQQHVKSITERSNKDTR